MYADVAGPVRLPDLQIESRKVNCILGVVNAGAKVTRVAE
jgi:hypothetical protein